MLIDTPAIVLATRPHGETAAIVRVLTQAHGMVAGYCAGARGRRLRPVLIPGNRVAAEFSARSDAQLPFLKAELVESRGPWMTEPLAAAGIAWATALTATALPERNPYPALYTALAALLDAICTAPSARGWAPALLGYEVLLLRELGYGGQPPMAEGFDAVLAALARSAALLSRYLLADRRGDVMALRTLLGERLGRMA